MSLDSGVSSIITTMFVSEDSSVFPMISTYFLIGHFLLLVFVVHRFLHRPTWILATTVVSILLILASTFPFQNETSHILFLLITTSKLLGPFLLGIVAFAHTVRPRSQKEPVSRTRFTIKLLNRSIRIPTLAFCFLQIEVACCFAAGTHHLYLLHSPAPIQGMPGALNRLAHERWAVSFVGAGLVLAVIAYAACALCGVIGVVRSQPRTATQTASDDETLVARQKLERGILLAGCLVFVLLCVKPLYQVFVIYDTTPISSEILSFPATIDESRTLSALLFDRLPTLAATAALVVQNARALKLQACRSSAATQDYCVTSAAEKGPTEVQEIQV